MNCSVERCMLPGEERLNEGWDVIYNIIVNMTKKHTNAVIMLCHC